MKKIKFRGKRIDNGDWTYGWLVVESNGTAWISKYYHKGEWEQVDPETVGQLTELKDKGGKEIWESDTVLSNGINYEVYQHPSGDWQAGGLSIWEQSGQYSEENEWEVVGNVFDNPELMEDNYEA